MTALGALLADVRRHRELTLGLVRRELFSPFAGSAFGVAWALLHPLAQMAIYLVVFTWIFQIRVGGADGSVSDTQTYMLSGMLPWMVWASLLGSACSAITGNGSLVKQHDFPAAVLPVRAALVALVPHLVGLAVLLLWVPLRTGALPWTVALLPLALALTALAMVGAALILSALSVFVRDLKEVVTVFVAMGIFLVPAFYTPDVLGNFGAAFRGVLAANPFTHFVHVYRDCLYWGEVAHPWSWGVVGLLALALPALGWRAFARLRLFFGNFL